jgi:L-proline amide hydrolase
MRDFEGLIEWDSGQTWFRMIQNDEPSSDFPVVILHGGPGAAHNYAIPIANLLTHRGFDVVLYDQIGCGQSSHFPNAPKEFWQMELFIKELTEVLSHLNIESGFYLLGHSWGGMLAMEYAVTKPPGLKGLILSNTLSSMPLLREELAKLKEQLPIETQKILNFHESEGTTDSDEYQEACNVFYRRHLIRINRTQYSLQSSEQRLKDPTVYKVMNGPSEFHIIGTLKDWSITEKLQEIIYPTLILSGLYDECTPKVHELIEANIKDSEWVLFEESSHSPFVEEAAKYIRVIEKFIKG